MVCATFLLKEGRTDPPSTVVTWPTHRLVIVHFYLAGTLSGAHLWAGFHDIGNAANVGQETRGAAPT